MVRPPAGAVWGMDRVDEFAGLDEEDDPDDGAGV